MRVSFCLLLHSACACAQAPNGIPSRPQMAYPTSPKHGQPNRVFQYIGQSALGCVGLSPRAAQQTRHALRAIAAVAGGLPAQDGHQGLMHTTQAAGVSGPARGKLAGLAVVGRAHGAAIATCHGLSVPTGRERLVKFQFASPGSGWGG